MPVNQDFGAHGEFAHAEHYGEQFTTVTVGVTDSYPLLATDASALLGMLSRTDSAPILISESAPSIFTVLARTDTLALLYSESAVIFYPLDTVTDTLSPMLSDASGVAVTLSKGDTVTLALSELLASPFVVLLSRIDSLKVLTERLTFGQDFGAHGEFAHGEHYLDRAEVTLFREDIEIFSTLSRADTLSPRADDVGVPVVVLLRGDTASPMITEGLARAEERLHRRVINVITY